MFYTPPTSQRERLSQELTVTYLNDIILEDASPCEGMQAMLNSRSLHEFHLNDEEILVRHLHKTVADHVHEGERAKERSEEHTSELQSLMRISYAVFCLKQKIHKIQQYY